MSSDNHAEGTQRAPRADFHDERIAMGYWFPKLQQANVRVPVTEPLPLDFDEDGSPEWDTEVAAEIVENLGAEAFVRTEFKSAQMHLEEGSHIHSAEADEIDRTLMELVSQQAMMQMPLGEKLYLREWLDLDWNSYARNSLHPEVRAFIRDGEVVCHHPRLEWDDDEAAGVVYSEQAEDLIERDWNDEIRPMAERVAEEFDGDGWFSVDFVCTTDYEWYCTDMALDALYERDGEVRGISEHPGNCEHDVEVLHQ